MNPDMTRHVRVAPGRLDQPPHVSLREYLPLPSSTWSEQSHNDTTTPGSPNFSTY